LFETWLACLLAGGWDEKPLHSLISQGRLGGLEAHRTLPANYLSTVALMLGHEWQHIYIYIYISTVCCGGSTPTKV
jgi:hypothetical protein